MKKQAHYIFVILIFQALSSHGQASSVNLLDEVVLSDVHLKKSSKSQQTKVFKDSVIEQNPASLTSILRFHTPLYFKENGAGMVSSVSFRGTTASQTAVIWNGININSPLTGQTDFNTLMSSNYDNITLRAGGGSVLYGSGAIGGSVHLNNRLTFEDGFHNELKLRYGSFNTFFGSYSGKYASEKTAIQFSVIGNSSDNDYEYPGTDKINLNGDYENYASNAAFAYILNEKNVLKLFSNYFSGERGFSGTLFAPSKSKYEDRNSRNLLQWTNFSGDFTTNLKLAYLDETYRYYENRQNDEYSSGNVKTGVIKYDLEYKLQSQMRINGLIDLEYLVGSGTNIKNAERKAASLGVLFSHDLRNLGYEVSLRKEVTDQYNSPLLFSIGGTYEVTDSYEVSLNLSRNYRIPTFNDLFWTSGGNTELQPEKSLQIEAGQKLHFREVSFEAIAYYIKIKDMLRWIPNSAGLWTPENTSSVRNFGIELWADWKKELGEHELGFSGTYAWTRSRDLDLNKTLIYVPEHKMTFAAAYNYKNLTAYYQHVYTDKIFTSSDNDYVIDPYPVANFRLEYNLFRDPGVAIGVEVENLWNMNYQIMPSRPMPGRSINSSLTINL